MKKIIVFIIATITINIAMAQTTAINESFESWPAPDWNIYEYGGGHWVHSTLYGSGLGYNGGNCAKIQINNDPCDNWLVSPQINVITGDYQLIFWELNDDLQYYLYEGVYISTGSGDPGDNDFIPLSESLKVEGTWVEHTVDLSSYQGNNIYIAFVYQGTWTHWNVDEVVISPSSLIDGALTEIVNPTGIDPVPSTEDVIVTLHNYGTDPINDTDIEWWINDVLQGTYQVTGLNLTVGDETNITLGQYNFATPGDYDISINLLLTGDANPSNDTIETTYYVSDPKDAALTQIVPEGYLPVSGTREVTVTVSNVGNFIIEDITVEWEVDGITQIDYDTISVNLEAGDEIDLQIGQYNFPNGLSEINATVKISADEDLSNNNNNSFVSVNILWESFEGDVFPPEMWSADDYPLRDYFFPEPHGDFYYVAQTDDNMFGFINDTLFTPLLDIENGDEITFWVNNSAFFTNDDKLIWKDGSTGAIHVIEDINSQLEHWDEVTIDISGAAGINYIGFVNNNSGSFGTSSLDLITSTASIYHFDYDLGIRDFDFDYLAKIGETHSFNVKVRNYGLQQVNGSDYIVKIIDGSGNVVAQEDGQTLQSWEQSIIEVVHTFTEIEELEVYAFIEYTTDQFTDNNTSVQYGVYVVPDNVAINDVGFQDQENLMIPFDTGGDTWTLGQDDLSQHIYYQDELGIEGYLYGITLYYHELFGVGQYLPLEVKFKETVLEDLTGGWIPDAEMTTIFNDTIKVYPGHNSVYIPFDEPILITGTSNIAFQYHQYEPEWPYTACRFSSTNVENGPVRAIRLNNVYNLDPSDPPDYWGEHTDYTYTSFVYQPIGEDGVISGTVYDENNDTIQWATVKVEGTSIVSSTGEDGIYTLPNLPYETYDITASYLGYGDSTQTIVLDTQNETLDFQLEPLPQVSLFGEVYGSNAPDVPLEGVLVTIDGYQTYSTYTNADGEFVFDDVYGANDYTITFNYYGYHDYTDSVTLENIDVDFGIVILDEEFISAYNVSAIPGTDQVQISWFDPITSQKIKLQNDTDVNWYSYMNEPYEEVWLGNLFDNENQITVTSVEVTWDIYEQAHDFVTIDIMDSQGNVLVSSQPFLTYNDSIMTIDVPNISIEGDFYAMVHWKDNPESTDPLTIDYSEDVPNTAYIKYPGETPILLLDFLGGPGNGSFFVRVNTLDEDPGKGNREALSYNIYRGLAEDIDEADTWSALNADPVTELEFIDETWSSSDPLVYTYAIEAVYVESYAEFTFSNFIAGFTGLDESEKYDVVIYPNPASSILNLSGVERTTITVYNILGNVIYSEDIETPTTKIDVSHFENGTYFIRIVGLHKQIVKKLIVAN